MEILVNEEMMEDEGCYHQWVVTTDDNNFPEDIMCSECKEVVIMVNMEEE